MKTVLILATLMVLVSIAGCAIVPLDPGLYYGYGYQHPYYAPHDGYHGYYGPYRGYGYR